MELVMSLNTEQQCCFDAFKKGHSIVITGPAGCGKSYLISKMKEYCRDNMINVAVTALTGAAASLIGGVTIHGWAGIGLAKGSAREIYQNMRRYRNQTVKRWYETKVLIIDEISMMDASLFNKLHLLAQIIRNDNENFFGGMQVVFCGDFAQLKPITEKGCSLKFAFESSIWIKYLTEHTYYLKKIIRQSNPQFQKLLERIRLGGYTSKDRELLNSRLITEVSEADVTVEMPDGSEQIIKATLLYPKRKDVERNNNMKLNDLIAQGARSKTFAAQDNVITKKTKMAVSLTENHIKILDNCTNAPTQLVICVGAQVMLIKNLNPEKQLVNGSRGVVIDINDLGLPVVLFDNGIEETLSEESFETESGDNIYIRRQIPLILGWALTIHKCQGASLSNVITDLTEVFDEAQVYVTLSRARSLEGLFIVNLNYDKIKCNSRVKKYYQELEAFIQPNE